MSGCLLGSELCPWERCILYWGEQVQQWQCLLGKAISHFNLSLLTWGYLVGSDSPILRRMRFSYSIFDGAPTRKATSTSDTGLHHLAIDWFKLCLLFGLTRVQTKAVLRPAERAKDLKAMWLSRWAGTLREFKPGLHCNLPIYTDANFSWRHNYLGKSNKN